jgi:DNA-binding PadR family transcriptional regulator
MRNTKEPTRLSATETLVLWMLITHGEMYGLQIVQQSQGEIARGSVYVLLDRMEDKGLVESQQEAKEPGVSGIPRRLYKPTGAGVQVLEAWQARRASIIGVPVVSFT